MIQQFKIVTNRQKKKKNNGLHLILYLYLIIIDECLGSIIIQNVLVFKG